MKDRWGFPPVTIGYVIVCRVPEGTATLSSAMTWTPLMGNGYDTAHVHSREAIASIAACAEAHWPNRRQPTHAIRAVHVPDPSGLFEGVTVLVDEAADRDNLLLAWTTVVHAREEDEPDV